MYKKIAPYKVRLGEPVYDVELGEFVRPFRSYTILERGLIGIVEFFTNARHKHRIKRKMVKTPYPRNIESDVFPPEKVKQKLDSNKHYLKELESEKDALLKEIATERVKLDRLNATHPVERDTRAIHMKVNHIKELRDERKLVLSKINHTKDTIDVQKADYNKRLEEEKKGVYMQ
ncbi:MAG: hypothetical protein ACXAEN_17715 [Candidatus Thorarchaeota archaeon]